MIKILYKKRNSTHLVTRASKLSAGWDLPTLVDAKLKPGERVLLPTGATFEIPKGYFGSIRPRSSLALEFGIDVLAGVIDSDYRGEVCVVLINHGAATVEIEKGQKIAQMIIQPYLDCALIPAESSISLSNTRRGEKGFGSSGR